MTMAMTDIRLRHLHREKTRHGKVVYYVRLGQGPRIRIDGEVGSEEFMRAYHKAVRGEKPDAPAKRHVIVEGSLAWLIDRYVKSPAFARLGESTQRARANILKKIAAESGRHALAKITTSTIIEGRDRRHEMPEAANAFVKALRAVFVWGQSMKLATDVTKDVKLLPSVGDGFHTWTFDEVSRFRQHFPMGTKARLAMELLLCTGLRRSDIVRLGKDHVRDGIIEIHPLKTLHVTNVIVTLPVVPMLAEAIAAGPVGAKTYLVSERGTPFTPESFTNWFHERCQEADVPGSAHGLRKAAATISAENGATERHLMSMFGWTSSFMATHYTKSANRKKMALDGAAFMPGQEKDRTAFSRTTKHGKALSGNSADKSTKEK